MHSYQLVADDDTGNIPKQSRTNRWLNDVWINKKKQIDIFLTVIILVIIICLVAAALFISRDFGKSSAVHATNTKVNSSLSSSNQSFALPFDSDGDIIMLDKIKRLPDSIIPLHYQIDLQPNYQQLYAIGNVEIQIQCLKRTYWITMHKKDIDIQSLSIYGDGIHYQIVNIRYDLKDELFYIQLDQQLMDGHYYYLKIRYKNKIIIHNRYGFYRSHYRNRFNQTRL